MTEKAKRKQEESPQPENKGLVALFLMFCLLMSLVWNYPNLRIIPSGVFDWNELMLQIWFVQNLFWFALIASLSLIIICLFFSYPKWILAGIVAQMGILLCFIALISFTHDVQFLDKVSIRNLDYHLLLTHRTAYYHLSISVCAENQCENYEILYCDACDLSTPDNPSQLTYDAESDKLIISMARGILRITPQELSAWQSKEAWELIES